MTTAFRMAGCSATTIRTIVWGAALTGLFSGLASGAELSLRNAANGSDSLSLCPGESGEIEIVLVIRDIDSGFALVYAFLNDNDDSSNGVVDVTVLTEGIGTTYDRSAFEPLPADISWDSSGMEYGLIMGAGPGGGANWGPGTYTLDTLTVTHNGSATGGAVDLTFENGARQPLITTAEFDQYIWGFGFDDFIPNFADPGVGSDANPFQIHFVACDPDLCSDVDCEPCEECDSQTGDCVSTGDDCCDPSCEECETCIAGVCVEDLCCDVSCDPCQACNPASGACEDVVCDRCQSCNPDSGECEDDEGLCLFCEACALCDGDVNCDGIVDPLDRFEVQAQWGLDPCNEENCRWDVNCDGAIDLLDTGFVASRIGTCDEPVSCPVCVACEPECNPCEECDTETGQCRPTTCAECFTCDPETDQCVPVNPLDCNDNGIPDDCELDGNDCNANGIPDECDIATGTSDDCDSNQIPDECDADCNSNGIPDDCDVAGGTSQDCNSNSAPDECDVAGGSSLDCNKNGLPDECEADCNGNSIPDECDISGGTSPDCNANEVPDECDISNGTSEDCGKQHNCCEVHPAPGCDDPRIEACVCNIDPFCCEVTWDSACAEIVEIFGCANCPDGNGVPDECEADCNLNGIPDECDIASGTSDDCNANGIPDECEAGCEEASDDDVADGETVVLNPGGGSNDLTEEALVEFTNQSGSGGASIAVVETTDEVHPDAGGFSALGTTLIIETSLSDGQFFMTVVVPFAGDDLAGEDPLTVDLVWFDEASGDWVLAVGANTQPSPGHEPDVIGDRFAETGTTTPTLDELSDDLGDYGVFWNTGTLQGFAWANVDHTTAFGSGVPQPCEGDANGDGAVDPLDSGYVLARFGCPVGTGDSTCDAADVNSDGAVDPLDSGYVLARFGTCGP